MYDYFFLCTICPAYNVFPYFNKMAKSFPEISGKNLLGQPVSISSLIKDQKVSLITLVTTAFGEVMHLIIP